MTCTPSLVARSSIPSSSRSTKQNSQSSNRSTAVDPKDLDLDPKLSSKSTSATAIMPVKREPSPPVLATWRSAKAVCFDVDSTLCEDESIDEIAAFLGVGEQVAALTSELRSSFFFPVLPFFRRGAGAPSCHRIELAFLIKESEKKNSNEKSTGRWEVRQSSKTRSRRASAS